MLLIFKTPAGDHVYRYNKAVVVCFKGKRKVLSTSPANGGYREDLTAVFNHDINPGAGMACKLKASTYSEHLAITAEELGLDRECTAGMGTAASMNNLAIKTQSHRNFAVTAIVTAGIDINGSRAGDPACYEEKENNPKKPVAETINIILEINANIPPHALVRALVTSTEAKSAALQELMAGSNYSTGLATGSGTDGVILISNADSSVNLTDTGHHSKLGELIGVVVKSAVKEALYKETKLSPGSQHSMLKRFKRYGLDEEVVWREYLKLREDENIVKLCKPAFIHNIHLLDKRDVLVTFCSLYIHLLDQVGWQLLSEDEARKAAAVILASIKKELDVEEKKKQLLSGGKNFFEEMMACFARVIAQAAAAM